MHAATCTLDGIIVQVITRPIELGAGVVGFFTKGVQTIAGGIADRDKKMNKRRSELVKKGKAMEKEKAKDVEKKEKEEKKKSRQAKAPPPIPPKPIKVAMNMKQTTNFIMGNFLDTLADLTLLVAMERINVDKPVLSRREQNIIAKESVDLNTDWNEMVTEFASNPVNSLSNLPLSIIAYMQMLAWAIPGAAVDRIEDTFFEEQCMLVTMIKNAIKDTKADVAVEHYVISIFDIYRVLTQKLSEEYAPREDTPRYLTLNEAHTLMGTLNRELTDTRATAAVLGVWLDEKLGLTVE